MSLRRAIFHFAFPIAICLHCLPVSAAQQSVQSKTSHAGGRVVSSSRNDTADYSKEDFVVERYEMNVRFENDGTGERTLHVRIHVQSDEGVQQFEKLAFPYDAAYEKVELQYIRVTKPDGAVADTTPNAVEDLPSDAVRNARPYADLREQRISIDALHPGDTLEYEVVTHILKPRDPDQFWFEHNFGEGAIVLDEQLILNVPKDREIRMKTRTGAAPEMRVEGDRKIYTWKRMNLSHRAESIKDAKSATAQQKAPSVEVSTFTSWDEVASRYAALEKSLANPNQEIRGEAEKLTAGEGTERGKVEAIYEYLTKNMQHVELPAGREAPEPKAAAEIFVSRIADSFDENTLFTALLESVGIQAEPALIATSRTIDLEMPSPAQLDRVLTVVPCDGAVLWLDSTSDVAPFLLLAPNLRDKQALLIASDGTGKMATTPADLPFPSTQRVEVTGTITELGTLTAHVRYVLRGDNETALRSAFRHTPESQWKSVGETVATLDGFHGNITSVKPSDPTATRDPFVLELEFSQPRFFDWTSKSARLAAPLPAIEMPDAPQDHSSAVQLGTPLLITVNMKLQFPASEQTRAPAGVTLQRDYAEYRSIYSATGNTVTAERTMKFKMREIPATQASDYVAFSHAVEDDEARPLVIDNPNASEEIPASATAEELNEAGAAALDAQKPEQAILLLNSAIKLDPKQKTVLDNLGLAYLRINQWSDAARTFKQQIELDSRDPQANEYLGVAYSKLNRFDEAEAAFHRQIEINPLDSLALSSLGELLLDQQKYSEAATQLDKAAVLIPSDPMLKINLARALVKTGKQQEAINTFQEAVRLSPKPAVWNSAAYNLAEADLDLEGAQQYAESAVQGAEAQLAKSSLKQITTQELTGAGQLAVYWDTLGWVYFRRGHMDLAEQYLESAWLLSERAEVGDHLGQLYEKRGEKDLAMHMYALSLAAADAQKEARRRLAALAGSDEKADSLVRNAGKDLLTIRTLPLGKIGLGESKSEFYVLLTPGIDHARAEDVKLAGDEKLLGVADRLRALNYGAMFPPGSHAKLVRIGTVNCSGSSGECSFVLTPPDDIRFGDSETVAHK
jgi:tetratricopeptide (TPR) repeat protein